MCLTAADTTWTSQVRCTALTSPRLRCLWRTLTRMMRGNIPVLRMLTAGPPLPASLSMFIVSSNISCFIFVSSRYLIYVVYYLLVVNIQCFVSYCIICYILFVSYEYLIYVVLYLLVVSIYHILFISRSNYFCS